MVRSGKNQVNALSAGSNSMGLGIGLWNEFGIGAAYFGLHGWQLAIMPVGAVLLGLSIMKD